MEPKELIFICGFMASGKSTHGKQLARNIGYHFIDLDDFIALRFDQDITELFQEKGEAAFRTIESEALAECIRDNRKTVIALGGGTPCFNDNLSLIKTSGKLIYLKVLPEVLYQRVFGVKSGRPLLDGKDSEEMQRYIRDLLATREQFYRQADLVIANDNLQEDEMKQAVLTFLNS